jgi:ATP-dependent RNA/DNA helicase IGHMBP2
MVKHPKIINLINCIELEAKAEIKKYAINEQHSLKALKAEGLAIQPISITQKTFGYADYPEFNFHIPYPVENNLFKYGAAIECFYAGEEPIKGILLELDNNKGSCRLLAPDFPDWIEDKGVGIKLAPDQRTTTILKKALLNIETNEKLFGFFKTIHGEKKEQNNTIENINLNFTNTNLNNSQKVAVEAIVGNTSICVIHGPPGTGKTTTIIEGILQLIKLEEKILVSAPSNAAIDHLCKGLLKNNINILRVGNTLKIDEDIFNHSVEGKLSKGSQQKEIKDLKIRAEAFRKMALKYKRSFGKAEREQRDLLFKEVKSIRAEIKQLQTYNEEKLFTEAQVILGTPIGLHDANLKKYKCTTLIIDEAGQCLEPLAWSIFPLAEKYVLAGDHLQLPPTVLSDEAKQKGLSISILEQAVLNINQIFLLDTQYRMHNSIANFSSNYFYNGKLQTYEALCSNHKNITFIDTAGSGFAEENGSNGISLQNSGEVKIILQLIENENFLPLNTIIITPYSGQVTLLKETLNQKFRVSTIDSFQGQEKEHIILSLVRSNTDNEIGFLKDYRRTNVALTRAKQKLFVIGDSATIGADNFYQSFLSYIEANGNYTSVWEMGLMHI